jgi:fermentation-respiration switch protein FrsA (DUF1100 family)
MIFVPEPLDSAYTYRCSSCQEVNLRTNDNETINALFFDKGSDRVVLYFHGNAGNLSSWGDAGRDLSEYGVSVLVIDYRGYGKSSGVITENGLYNDAQAAYEYLISRGFPAKKIIIYGRSIGTGVAVDLASKHESAGLILESPFASMRQLAWEKAPYLLPGLYLSFNFMSIEKIGKVQSPVLIFHGMNDTLIPIGHGRKLYKALNGKGIFVAVPGGGHNNLSDFPEYREAMLRYLNR